MAHHPHPSHPHVIVYADGACSGNPGPGGWGAIVWDTKARTIRELGGATNPTTNNRMELLAVIKALASLPSRTEVRVLTDSNYVIKGATEWRRGWVAKGWRTAAGKPVMNQDLWEELYEEVDRLQVRWKHVKGHAGIPGNERVDEIATAHARGTEPELFEGAASRYTVDLVGDLNGD